MLEGALLRRSRLCAQQFCGNSSSSDTGHFAINPVSDATCLIHRHNSFSSATFAAALLGRRLVNEPSSDSAGDESEFV